MVSYIYFMADSKFDILREQAKLSLDQWGAKAKLAKYLGIKQSTLGDFLSGRTDCNETTRRRIAEYIGFSSYDEAIGVPKVYSPDSVVIEPKVILVGDYDKTPEDMEIGDYYAAPLINGHIAAGSGRIVEEDIQSFVWIYGPSLKDRRRHNMNAVKIGPNEKSMVPTLRPGDIVLIDRDDPKSESGFRDGRVYAIRTDSMSGECAIKRLYRDDESECLMISSDNRKYPPKTAWTNDIQLLIIGRVVWGWRNLLDV